jgi:recombination protein RecA
MDKNKDKEKAIDSVISKINKQYGDGALMKLGTKKTIEVPVIPTGSISLDAALGIGGIPRGRAIEIYGRKLRAKLLLLYILPLNRKKEAERLLL